MMKNKKITSLYSPQSAFRPQPSALSPQPFERGFTLVELAMVLVVLGLLIGLGASLIGPLMKQTRINESRDVVRAAREAVIGYAMQYKMLPATIAAAGGRNTDAWGHSLESYYYKDAILTGSNLCVTTPAYTIATVNDNRTTPPTPLTNKVVVLLLSPGENGTNDTVVPSPYYIYEYGSGPTNTYDDIVEYIDIAFLREKICNAFRITTDNLPIGTVETSYPSTTLGATDGTPAYTWSLTSGSLPAGLSLSAGGVISGTPTTAGTYSFIVQASDSDSTPRTTTKSLTITINPNNPVITTEFLNYGTISVVYPTVTLSATGGTPAYTWSLTSGSLPAGLSLSAGGVISGTPTAAGTYSFTATVTDNAARQASKTLSVTINPY